MEPGIYFKLLDEAPQITLGMFQKYILKTVQMPKDPEDENDFDATYERPYCIGLGRNPEESEKTATLLLSFLNSTKISI